MDTDQRYPSTHLFTLRVWLEDLDDGQSEPRGKVQHVLSGEARYFRDWDTLVTFVIKQVNRIQGVRRDA